MLDAMLGNANSIESVGELVSGIRRYDELCSCGQTFQQCHFWQNVRKQFEGSGASWDSTAGILMKQAHLKSLPATYLLPKFSKWSLERRHANEMVFNAIAENTSKQYVVDSSKEVTRALFLIKHHPESKIIHLVKSPVTVLESTYYRLVSGAGFRFLRRQFRPKKVFWPALTLAASGWLIGNLLAEFVRLQDQKRFVRVRYEDIATQPLETMAYLEAFLEIDLGTIQTKLKNNDAFEIGHNIGGNHMRHSKSFVFDPSKQSRGGLPARYEKLVKFICYPLMKKYGYWEGQNNDR